MNFYTLLLTSLCFYCEFLKISTEEICDKSKCPGPLQYYKEVNCKPIYKFQNDCCAYKYNCDHLKQRSSKKCYVNGHEYNIGEMIRREDSGDRCNYRCTCIENNDGIAVVACFIIDYAFPPKPRPDCYYKRNAVDCAPGQLICPEKPEDRPTCEVDGHIYRDGDFFVPFSEPNKQCYCGPGYTGKNNKPYCTEPMTECNTELNNHNDIHNKCAPILSTSPLTNCTLDFRCQTSEDSIIAKNSNDAVLNNDMTCEYGNLTINYGDELNQVPFINNCMRCVCEVGPALTCDVIRNDYLCRK